MQPKHRALGVAAGLLAAGLIWGDTRAQVALTGLVSAPDEGPMEGVLVSAKKEGSTITTTVVSDQQGAFSFPSARLEPGKYTISIRAIGYRLDGAKTVDVPAAGVRGLTPLHEQTYPSASFASLDVIAETFLATASRELGDPVR